ncbi:hypothetical protein ACQCN2_17215 [Brevibacillus ginsengisoli]|uniref:hypothetical protein n=1 Tax=Brevibacillus ginsengisoli TaxID=363854 RepID=UPI003CF43987
MGANKYSYLMIALVGLGLLFQVYGVAFDFINERGRGMLLGKLSTLSLGFFVLVLGVWLYREKRDFISGIFLVACTTGFVSLVVKVFI